MNILHTSDWHFGMVQHKANLYEDQRYFLEQLYRIIEDECVDAVICAGDVYDSSVVNAQAIELYNEAVTRICMNLKTPFIVIAGNHDSGPRLSACSELLRIAGLYVSGRLTKELRPIALSDSVDIYAVPFFNREEVISLFPDKAGEIKDMESATKVYMDYIRENMDKSKVNIVVAHAYIVDSELSESDRAAQVGFASAVSKRVFDGFDYVALGHIHKPQKISDTIRYSGSPVKYSFGKEEKHNKQVVIYNTDTKEIREIPISMLHDRRTIEGSYEELLGICDERNYLRMVIKDKHASLERFATLKEKCPLLLELKGLEYENSGVGAAITIDQLEKMDETDILMEFLKEECEDYEITDEQLALFKDVVEWSKKEDEIS